MLRRTAALSALIFFGWTHFAAAKTTPQLLKDLSTSSSTVGEPSVLVDVGGTLVFTADNWVGRSDGTVQGTSGFQLPVGTPKNLHAGAGAAFYIRTSGGKVWMTDGTESGTAILVDTCATGCSSQPRDSLRKAAELNGELLFSGGAAPDLWKTNGTTAGTTLVSEIEAPGFMPFTTFGGGVYFSSGLGESLFRSDGTKTGTVQVTAGAGATQAPTGPNAPVVLNGKLFIAALDGQTPALWSIAAQATKADRVTTVLGHAVSGCAGSTRMYFVTGPRPGEADSVWTSDGTDTGTTLVKKVAATTSAGTIAESIACIGDTAVFAVRTGTDTLELWKTAGTAQNTAMLHSFGPNASIYGFTITTIGGLAYFAGADATEGAEPWQTDGTAAGTRMIAALAKGATSSSPRAFTHSNGHVFFTATGNALSDGGSPTMRGLYVLRATGTGGADAGGEEPDGDASVHPLKDGGTGGSSDAAATKAPSGTDSGCGCRTIDGTPSPHAMAGVGLCLALTAAARRRRRP